MNARLMFTAAFSVLSIMSLTACAEETKTADISDSAVSADAEATETVTALDYDKYRVKIDGTKFTVDGKEWWINGVNTPWDNWNDFGGNFDEAFWDSHFAELHNAGVNASRVWVNCNGMSIMRLKSDGTVKEIKEKHWTDLDKLFELAEKHEIYLMPTLLSFDHFKDGNAGCEQFRLMVSDEAATQSYIDSYVIPFVQRYGDSPMLWSIDLMNEPDWVYENDECGKVPLENLCTFFAKCSAAIHENSDELVTVGTGMVKYNSDKHQGNHFSDAFFNELGGENAYLDFYSPHYYFWQNSFLGYPFEQTPEAFGLETSKPCVIGETAIVNESGRTPEQDYENAYNNGWNGVMSWTSNGVDKCGTLNELHPALDKMMSLAKDKIFPHGFEERDVPVYEASADAA